MSDIFAREPMRPGQTGVSWFHVGIKHGFHNTTPPTQPDDPQERQQFEEGFARGKAVRQDL